MNEEYNNQEIMPALVIKGNSEVSNRKRRTAMINCSEIIRQFGNIVGFKIKEKNNLRFRFETTSNNIVPLIGQLRGRKLVNEETLTDNRVHPGPKEEVLVSLDIKLAS